MEPSITEQKRLDAVDLTEGKRGAGYMVSISLEEYKALKDALESLYAAVREGQDLRYHVPEPETVALCDRCALLLKVETALALVAKPDSACASLQTSSPSRQKSSCLRIEKE